MKASFQTSRQTPGERLSDGPSQVQGCILTRISRITLNPSNEIEAALAMQLASTHFASMNVLGRLHGNDRRVSSMASAAARLQNAYRGHVEVMMKLRGQAQQSVRVKHVHVHEGGQAVVGKVEYSKP